MFCVGETFKWHWIQIHIQSAPGKQSLKFSREFCCSPFLLGLLFVYDSGIKFVFVQHSSTDIQVWVDIVWKCPFNFPFIGRLYDCGGIHIYHLWAHMVEYDELAYSMNIVSLFLVKHLPQPLVVAAFPLSSPTAHSEMSCLYFNLIVVSPRSAQARPSAQPKIVDPKKCWPQFFDTPKMLTTQKC